MLEGTILDAQAQRGMPTVLFVRGWRFFFYSNEGDEPIHIHCQKAGKECKCWLDRERFGVTEAYSYRLNAKDERDVKRIIYENFEWIEQKWDEFQGLRAAC